MPRAKTKSYSNLLQFPVSRPNAPKLAPDTQYLDINAHITGLSGLVTAYEDAGENIKFVSNETGRVEWMLIRVQEVENA